MNQAITEFLNYTSDYLEYGERVKLKVKHTFRVMRLCEALATKLNLTDEEIYISKIIGLLHDIGRFEQWKQYQTYEDGISLDHANFGVKVLNNDNYIRKFIEDDKYDDIILKSVKYHNKYLLPKSLKKNEKLFCNIIRDADKIDILRLYTLKVIELELDKEFSEDIYQALLNRDFISRKDIKSKTDRFAISLGFIFDTNYKESIEYLKEKKYYDTIIDMYKDKTDNNKLKAQLEEIRKVINNYIEEMLTC